jgi:hypothetical protein
LDNTSDGGVFNEKKKDGPLIYQYDSSLQQVVLIQEPTTTTTTTPLADSIRLDHNRNLTKDKVFLSDRLVIQKGVDLTNTYCPDILDLMDIRDNASRGRGDDDTPLLAIFGDYIGDAYHTKFPIPMFAKYRGAAATTPSYSKLNDDSTSITAEGNNHTEPCLHRPYPSLSTLSLFTQRNNKILSPIIWKLNTERHWKPLHQVKKADIPWRLKRNQAIFRGVLTGYLGESGGSNLKRCQGNSRCHFVLEHYDSAFLNVGLTDLLDVGMDRQIQGVELLKDMKSMEDMLEYKMIISLEGNDVSSGLKWQLLSRSVVIMAHPPTFTSWAMEELLEAWVHYVPMDAQGSNAEEMVSWVLEHDEQAQQIAERATLFMEDMVYHPDAAKEERQIKEEMVRRYQAHWTTRREATLL